MIPPWDGGGVLFEASEYGPRRLISRRMRAARLHIQTYGLAPDIDVSQVQGSVRERVWPLSPRRSAVAELLRVSVAGPLHRESASLDSYAETSHGCLPLTGALKPGRDTSLLRSDPAELAVQGKKGPDKAPAEIEYGD
eukprot:2213706-Rhodomonas_salina.1